MMETLKELQAFAWFIGQITESDAEQRTPAWFEVRKDRLTGSVIGAALDISPWSDPESLTRSLVRAHFGFESEFKGNVATEYGSANEWAAVNAFEEYMNTTVRTTGFWMFDDWLGASPDGITAEGRLLEIKCPYGLRNETTPAFKSLEDQPHYYAQMQIQMLCTSSAETHFWQWSPNGTAHTLVKRDDAWLAEYLPKLREFYENFLAIIADEELAKPYLEDLEVDMSGDNEWINLEAQYLAAMGEQKKLESVIKDLKQKLIDKAEGRKCTSDNLTVYQATRAGSVSYVKLAKDHPEIDMDKYRGKESTYWTVRAK